MTRRKQAVDRQSPVLLIDKETGEQWLYNNIGAVAKALGRSRQWVSQVLNDPTHVVHKTREELGVRELFTAHGGMIYERRRGGYFRYDIRKYKPVLWRLIATGETRDGQASPVYSLSFPSLRLLAGHLGLSAKYTYSLFSKLDFDETTYTPVFSHITGEGFLVERCTPPKFKDGADAKLCLAGLEPVDVSELTRKREEIKHDNSGDIENDNESDTW